VRKDPAGRKQLQLADDLVGAQAAAGTGSPRLEAAPADDVDIDALYEAWWNNPDADLIIGITDVPGGCVITQPWGNTASTPGVIKRVSPGTVCYSMYANPKGGSGGRVARDGAVITAWEPHSACTVPLDALAEEILAAYLYSNHSVAEVSPRVGTLLSALLVLLRLKPHFIHGRHHDLLCLDLRYSSTHFLLLRHMPSSTGTAGRTDS
jgi:hypothetical protein